MKGLTVDEYAILCYLESNQPRRQVTEQERPLAFALCEQGRVVLITETLVYPGAIIEHHTFAITAQGTEAVKLWPLVREAMERAA